MVIGLQRFNKYMNKIMNSFDLENELNEVLRKYNQETRVFNNDTDIAIDLLYDMFNDDKEELISYFIYTIKFGRDYDKCPITDENGDEVSLRNSTELYNLLIENMEEES